MSTETTEPKVEVRPLPIVRWHGKKGKESFTQSKVVEVLRDPSTGRYATGLTPEQAEKYGKILGVDLSDTFVPHVPHVYWSTKASWTYLPNQTTIFYPSNPMDFVKIQNMKASSRVANSLKAWEEGHYPDATHYIYDEEEAAANTAKKGEDLEKAYVIVSKMTQEDKENIVLVLSNKSVKGRSSNFLSAEITEAINKDPQEFIRVANKGREELGIRAKVLEALLKNIFTREGKAVLYLGTEIASSYEGAVDWFKDPNNTKLKVSILEKLENAS